MGVPIALYKEGARRRAYRRALFESARRGYVWVVPSLIWHLGLGLGREAAEGRALLIKLLRAVTAAHADALRPVEIGSIARLLPRARHSPPPSEEARDLIVAALAALAHVGGACDLPRIRPLVEVGAYAGLDTGVRSAAEEAIAAIEARLAREATQTTLLRPARSGAEVLLRPAEGDETNLLRAAEEKRRTCCGRQRRRETTAPSN